MLYKIGECPVKLYVSKIKIEIMHKAKQKVKPDFKILQVIFSKPL